MEAIWESGNGRIWEIDLRLESGPVRIEGAASVDPLLEKAESADRIPFWATLWPSAPALARELPGEEVAGKPVLELGCGLGLCGIVARLLGAEVDQTDYFTEALEAARRNAERNGVEGIHRFLADWRDHSWDRKYPLVIGSDLLYESGLHPSLEETLRATLAPGGQVLLTDPYRGPSLDFMLMAEARGWQVSTKPIWIELDSVRYSIQLLRLVR